MKKPILIALITELLIAYFLLASVCVRPHETASAWKAWHDNPTPETQAAFDKQKRINTCWEFGFSTFFFALMAGPALYVGRMMNRRHLAANPATP
jgi:hypothetical protein